MDPLTNIIIPAHINRARVTDVNIERYTCSVAYLYDPKQFTGISFMTPYQHFYNGEGIYFMPEVGSVCWVCEPSDGDRPFIIGWCPAQNQGNQRANKTSLNPGDIFLGTRDENSIILRRGGVIQIFGGPLSQRLYIPIENTIRDICETYHMQTLAGEMEWSVGRTVDTTDGNRPTALKLTVRERANDAEPIASLVMGAQDDSDILSININKSGSRGAESRASLKITKDGSVSWELSDFWLVHNQGDITLKTSGAGKKVLLESENGPMSLYAKQAWDAKGSTIEMVSQTSAKISAPTGITLNSQTVNVGGESATNSVAVAPALIRWLMTHTHTVSGTDAAGVVVTGVAAPSVDAIPPEMSSTVLKTTS